MIFVLDLIFINNKRDFKANKVQFPDTRSPHISIPKIFRRGIPTLSTVWISIVRSIWPKAGQSLYFFSLSKKVGRKECKCKCKPR